MVIQVFNEQRKLLDNYGEWNNEGKLIFKRLFFKTPLTLMRDRKYAFPAHVEIDLELINRFMNNQIVDKVYMLVHSTPHKLRYNKKRNAWVSEKNYGLDCYDEIDKESAQSWQLLIKILEKHLESKLGEEYKSGNPFSKETLDTMFSIVDEIPSIIEDCFKDDVLE